MSTQSRSKSIAKGVGNSVKERAGSVATASSIVIAWVLTDVLGFQVSVEIAVAISTLIGAFAGQVKKQLDIQKLEELSQERIRKLIAEEQQKSVEAVSQRQVNSDEIRRIVAEENQRQTNSMRQ